MKKLLALFYALLFSVTCAHAQYLPPGTGAAGPLPAPGANNNVMTSNGSAWTSAAPSGGAGTFVPPAYVALSTLATNNDVAVSQDLKYAYVTGTLSSNSHGCIAQVNLSSGAVVTCDLGAGVNPQGIAVSNDGTFVCAYDKTAGTTWWKVTTSNMTIAHTSTLVVAIATTTAQQWDMSPDSSKYVYVSGVDAKLYVIDTAAYGVTNQTMNHTAGNLVGVCFYNGSNTNVYVSHAGSATIDLYAIGGAYTSSVNTTASGTPSFTAMRGAPSSTVLFILDNGTVPSAIQVASGTPTINTLGSLSPSYVSVSTDAIGMFDTGATAGSAQVYVVSGSLTQGVPLPPLIASNIVGDGVYGSAWYPDHSGRVLTLNATVPQLWSLSTVNPPVPGTTPVTTVAGSTSGNLYWSMPSAGNGGKKVIINLSSFHDAGTTLTFPTAFTYTPVLTANSTGLAIATLTTTQIVIPAANNSGTICIEGF